MKEMNRHFSKEDIEMSKRHMKRCSMLLRIREMQIKTTRRYHLTLSEWPIINKSTNNKCLQGYGEKETLLHCWWECRFVQPLWKSVWRHLKKLKMDLPYDPVIPLLGICQKRLETLTRKTRSTSVFMAVLFTKAKIWKQPLCL